MLPDAPLLITRDQHAVAGQALGERLGKATIHCGLQVRCDSMSSCN